MGRLTRHLRVATGAEDGQGPGEGRKGRECDVGWVLSFWGRAPAPCQWGTAEC